MLQAGPAYLVPRGKHDSGGGGGYFFGKNNIAREFYNLKLKYHK